MSDVERLKQALRRIDGRQYPAYRDLRGEWDLGSVSLIIDHVQGDPFASPSSLRVVVDSGVADSLFDDDDGKVAAEDWLLRRFVGALGERRDREAPRRDQGRGRGSGKSGVLEVYRPGPEIVERSALRLFRGGEAEVRFRAGLPANGRRINGRLAEELLLRAIPEAARAVRFGPGLAEQVASVRAQRELRRQLEGRGLVAFIANGAVLPRESGVSSRPLRGAIPFESPPELEVTIESSLGDVVGAGIPEGVTLIVGGGFHGKSTLLQALQTGHLDFCEGDGRERVVSVADAVKVRAEDGRAVTAVDISLFLNGLPGGRSTAPFSTEDASGSTSQAAAMMEAIESGATALLIDEDTSATNLLVRDERMRALVPSELEPITPFVERVEQLYREWGVSTVMVVGGVGDYLAVADRVIGMEEYRAHDLTERAKELAGPAFDSPGPLPRRPSRELERRGLQPGRRVRARSDRRIEYGDGEIDLSGVEQLVGAGLAFTIGQALRVLHERLGDEPRPLGALLDRIDELFDDGGLEELSPTREPSGGLVRPRRHEIAAALNRLRGARFR